MKINWKIGIIVLYTGFVAMMLLLVGMSLTQKIDLVTENYYEEELQFQEKIDKVRRAAALTSPLTWEVNERVVLIRYPRNVNEKNITGNLKLYCPSDIKNDRNFAVSSSNNQQFIPTAAIPRGTYYLQIDWKSGDQSYWNEDVIVIKH